MSTADLCSSYTKDSYWHFFFYSSICQFENVQTFHFAYESIHYLLTTEKYSKKKKLRYNAHIQNANNNSDFFDVRFARLRVICIGIRRNFNFQVKVIFSFVRYTSLHHQCVYRITLFISANENDKTTGFSTIPRIQKLYLKICELQCGIHVNWMRFTVFSFYFHFTKPISSTLWELIFQMAYVLAGANEIFSFLIKWREAK